MTNNYIANTVREPVLVRQFAKRENQVKYVGVGVPLISGELYIRTKVEGYNNHKWENVKFATDV
jgi:hypothetical protein